MMVMGVGSAWGQTYHTEEYDYDGDGTKETYNVVYLTVGGSNGTGTSSTSPVNTWANAYKKLPNYTGITDADRDEAWDHNIIVLQNTNTSGTLLIDETIAKGNGTQGIPATITGVWPWNGDNITATNVKKKGMITLNNKQHNNTVGSGTTRIGADTKFKYVRFSGGANSFLSMYLHDCTFDVGCVMDDITAELPTTNGATAGRKTPDMQVFLFATTYNFDQTKTDGGWPQQTKPVTLTIKSGKFGRILSNRVTGTDVASIKNRYVTGNPEHPLMCIVNVDIDATTSTDAWNSKNYPDDIAFLCAGMTQGVEYADVQFNIKRGKIATLVGAMQGNSLEKTVDAGLSNSSFLGRTVTNLIPEDDADVTIQRYYAGCLGRYTASSSGGVNGISNAAFYGQSILNMHGGTIASGAYVSAGGISGLKSPNEGVDYHTNDKFIPYLDGTASKNYPYMGITYQSYDANKTMPTVATILNGTAETIDLTKTITQMNIYGGTIEGGVFGGSYGYSPEMPAKFAMAGAGSLWGETNVNIYGGTINGGVYGGGEGSPNYYNDLGTNKTNDKVTTRDGFLTVASVYGNTNVNIYGGTFDDTGIYGAGKGIKYQAAGGGKVENEFTDIAKVYGATNVLIDPQILKDRALWADPAVPEFTGPNEGWTFTGNIYGGGALGAVEGNTNVIIKGGTITGNVFGAGQGEEGHPEKAKVTGDTNVIVDKD